MAVQHLLRHLILQKALDGTAQGAGPVFVVITLVNQVISSRLAHREGDAELLFAPLYDAAEHDIRDSLHVLLGKLLEDDDLINPV